MTDLNAVADLYVDMAESSLNARLVGEQKRHRAESYGVLRSLVVLIGMDGACRLRDHCCLAVRIHPLPVSRTRKTNRHRRAKGLACAAFRE